MLYFCNKIFSEEKNCAFRAIYYFYLSKCYIKEEVLKEILFFLSIDHSRFGVTFRSGIQLEIHRRCAVRYDRVYNRLER